MNVKLLTAVVAVLLLLPAARAQDIVAQEVEKALAALNEAFAKGDAKAVAALMTDDHVAVTSYYGGPQTREEQLKSLSDMKLEEYRPKAMKVRVVSRDAAVVRYELAMKGTYKGTAVAARSYASAVWVREGGKWLEAFYQETPLADRP